MENYTLKRGNRRTISVEIKGSEVIVHVPNEYDRSAAIRKRTEDFLRSKQEWIEKKLGENKRNEAELLPGFTERKTLYLFGYPLEVTEAKAFSVRFENGKLIIPAGRSAESAERAIKRWYRKYSEDELSARLAAISGSTGLKYSSFSLTSARGKWGSCSNKGDIMLNFRLVILPDELIEYVIVHELCHTLEMDHSSRFWAEVAERMPDYKQRRRALRRYGFLMRAI